MTQDSSKAAPPQEKLPGWLDDTIAVPASKVLIAVNVGVFLAMTICTVFGNAIWHTGMSPMEGILLFSSRTLENWGSNSAIQTILDKQYWRILTNTFVHLNAFHMAMNMYVLWNFSTMVERLFGQSKFLVIYIMAAMGSSVCSLLFLKPESISVGASGAIFGTCGALVAFFVAHRKFFPKAFFRMYAKMFFVCVIYSAISPLIFKDMDNASHLGGFLVGMWAAFSVLPVKPGAKHWRKMDFVRIAGLFAVLVCGLVLISTVDARDPKAISEHEYAKAVNLLNQDQPADALIHLNNALKLVPRNTSAYLDRAAAYNKLQRYDESIADATTALTIEPNNKKAYLERSLGYQHLEQNDLAIADLNKFVALDPKAAVGYNNRAWSYVVSGRIDEAIADSLMSIKLDKHESSAYDTLGMAYILKGDYIPALDQFTACLQQSPNEGAAMYHRAYAYYCLHQEQLGRAQFKLAQQSFCRLDSFEKHLMAPMFESYKLKVNK